MHTDDHDKGLAHDIEMLLARRAQRRDLLAWAAGIAAVTLTGCSSSGACVETPEETAGPYPGDGSNGANALALTGIVRSDIRASIATASAVAEGIQLTVTLTVQSSGDCGKLAGYAVYLWHCDRDGEYSMYTGNAANENYLRGVQETDAEGIVTFTTIFPGCYSGRWPHMHFEVYPSLTAAASADNLLATSQLALPEAACNEAYAVSGYESSVSNFAKTSLDSDGVFEDDGAALQLADVSGNATDGFSATLTISVDA